MMLPEEYISKCLQIATEALKKIANSLPEPQCCEFCNDNIGIAEHALNEMRRLP